MTDLERYHLFVKDAAVGERRVYYVGMKRDSLGSVRGYHQETHALANAAWKDMTTGKVHIFLRRVSPAEDSEIEYIVQKATPEWKLRWTPPGAKDRSHDYFGKETLLG